MNHTLSTEYSEQRSRLLGLALLFMAALALLMLPGCGGDKSVKAKSTTPLGDSVRPVALDSKSDISVLVMGESRPTLLGGEEKHVAAGVTVQFQLIHAPTNGDLTLSHEQVLTDQGGKATAEFQTGSVPGTYTIRVDLPSEPQIKPVYFHVLAGIRLLGAHQDGSVGKALSEPLVVLAESAPGVPAAGVKIDVERGRKATVLASIDLTDSDGRAESVIRLGKKAGLDAITVRIRDPRWNGPDGPVAIHVPVFALDWFGLAVQTLGGLAIFIFGMRLMSEGLSLVAGNRLRAVLHHLTRNRFFAVIAGLITTGLIQSSSACSVMVIGFVNAGLMQLRQAIGVIMGANIGTTVTAQMLSFKLGVLALPAVAAGVLITLIAKKRTTQFWAQILIGFGFLFYGMSVMGAPLKILKDSATIVSFFDNLSCAPGANGVVPLGMLLKAIAAGTIMTLIVQSSSAAIGILLAMAAANLIDPYTAVAVLLGDNIGTTITAVLAAIGSTQTAKRTACAHVLFNCTGVIVAVFLFYVPWNGHPVFMELINRLTPGDVFKGENLPRYLANAHTAFNVTATLILIWLVGPLAYVCRRVIPTDDPSQGTLTRLLEPHLLAAPGIALGQAWAELGVMLEKGHQAYQMSFHAMVESDDSEWEEKSDSIRTPLLSGH